MNHTFTLDSVCKTYISQISLVTFRKNSQPQVKKALSGVSITLTPGLYGLLGPNGAGKSTLIHIITGTLAPDSGEVLWCGKPAMGIGFRRILGYMPQQQGLYDSYTGRRFLAYMAALKEIPRKAVAAEVDRVAAAVNLTAELDNRLSAYSGGMKQRVVIAMALANSPQLLIADEPTSALDVTIQAQVMEMIQDLIEKQGTSLILITHDLGLVATSCDDVAVVYAGEIIEYGSKEEIYDHPSHPYTIGLFGAIPNLESDVRRLANIEGLPPDPSNLPTGCSFAPRCPYATEECRTKPPKSEQIAEKHYCSCYIGRQKRGAV